MPLRFLAECYFHGPALPEPFVEFELERELNRLDLLPKTTGEEGRALAEFWTVYRRRLRELGGSDGALRIRRQVIEPLMERLGYARIEDAGKVRTREGDEDGGWLLTSDAGARLRVWTTNFDEDLDAPAKRGAAYRFSRVQIANRVIFASGERMGLIANGAEIRMVIGDPARPPSEIVIPIDPEWRRSRDVPDAFRLLHALAQPAGLAALQEILDKARVQQARVTSDLRKQAREAVERFAQEVLDHPENLERLAAFPDRAQLARDLWHEGLILVYRLLFLLKMESTDDPARSFRFASSTLWRKTFSPGQALHPCARRVLESGEDTGTFLEDGLRQLFRMFAEGLEASELHVAPLGGMLFGEEATPVLSQLAWGERAVAILLDRLLLTEPGRGDRRYVHYGSLELEDLGRVYENLLELEPGIAVEPLCRLKRQKLEVVVPADQGERYRDSTPSGPEEDGEEDEEAEEESAPARGRTLIQWMGAIAPGRFYLRVGLGRKASGSYYTPNRFVRFLVEQTLGPLVDKVSPAKDPNPAAILKLKVLDPAMGSGHFLVDACRFLGARLYEACRACDLRAAPAERRAEAAIDEDVRAAAIAEAETYRGRVIAVAGPDGELLSYLPSRAVEGGESGVSQRRAEALCRRLVAVHCLYGVDKNLLAVELAKLCVWIEAHAEGLPLTFLNHRLVLGDSLTGPFFEHLLTFPRDRSPLEGLFADGLRQRFRGALTEALLLVKDLEADIGASLPELKKKEALKRKLDDALAPFRAVAASWAGRLMSNQGTGGDYVDIVRQAVAGAAPEDELADATALPFDLAFPEVFFPYGNVENRRGFDAVLGNPPWDRMLPADKEFFATYNFEILNTPTVRERARIQRELEAVPVIADRYGHYIAGFRGMERVVDAFYPFQVAEIDGERTIGKQDAFRAFMERDTQLLAPGGSTGVVVPSAFHANEGATGVRRLYFERMAMRCCYSFENRRKLFEIDSRFKFATVVAARPGPTKEFSCAFYLHDDEFLFRDERPEERRYSLDFVRRTGGAYLNLVELRSAEDLAVAETCFGNGEAFGAVCERLGIRLGRELNMTDDARRFTPVEDLLPAGVDSRDPEVAAELLDRGYLVLHEGKTFHQYTDRWDDRPRYAVALEKIADKPEVLKGLPYFRLAFRDVAGSTNERCLIFAFIRCALFGHTALRERTPDKRPNCEALAVEAILNAFPTDWCLRLKVATHASLFMLLSIPLPRINERRRFLSHAALRLTCNHAGYAALWKEQLGCEWREAQPLHRWPVLPDDQSRQDVRSAIDAAVAHAYGLTRAQYEHVLSTFSHRSHPGAPALCLGKFDEYAAIGAAAFTRKYDPYWDIPLVETLPQPVIELPGVEAHAEEFALNPPPAASENRRGRRRR
ncbi:MAG: hypothetical protein P4L56_30085 [Candidatus Sulfopaludibacter sp.]|nr:hypothetical protein [Candidatus Sulfopaludibacter sp.]